ncbi:hypothetical protein ACFWB1_26575 [Streptomyces goshikiensis]|uniref:hypothetical protein n=1 Tax=Streptomyces goshikiensis TaxID=1942 RepID=UPI0036B13177
MYWLLVRQGRLNEAERIAAQSMDAVEPQITGPEPDHYAVWGGLAMEAAAAAARNNRPDAAKEYRKAAHVVAAAVGTSHRNVSRHWSAFGPVTAAMKALEDSKVVGDARAVVRKAGEQEELSPKAWKCWGRPSTNDGSRFTLDVARTHTRAGDLSAAMDELTRVRKAAPEWMRHQKMAAETMQETGASASAPSRRRCARWPTTWASSGSYHATRYFRDASSPTGMPHRWSDGQ